jgi:acetyl esterase/lipase
MKNNYSLQDVVGFLLGIMGGFLVSSFCFGLALTAGDASAFILPVIALVLVCSAVPGSVAQKHPVLLWGLFVAGYLPFQVILGAALIGEGNSVALWVITHLAVVLLAALGIWIGRVVGSKIPLHVCKQLKMILYKRHVLTLLLCASTSFFALAESSPKQNKPTAKQPTQANVAYGAHERQVIDFYQAKSEQPTPVLINFHGGGWSRGDKSDANTLLTHALSHGISYIAINYRLIPDATAEGISPPVKAPLEDAARAVQFVRSKATEWNIDKNLVVLAGGSAGACSALWLAFHDDMAEPQSADPVARESTRPAFVIAGVVQTSLDPKQMKEWTPNINYGAHAFGFADHQSKNFEGFLAARESILPWINEYSPYALLTADDPPVFLFYQDTPAVGQPQKDPTHTSNFGAKLKEKGDLLGVECVLVYPGAPETNYKNGATYLTQKLKELKGQPQ